MLKYAAGGTASYRARLGSTLKICRASVNLVRLVGPQMPGHVAKRLESQAAEEHLQAKEIRKFWNGSSHSRPIKLTRRRNKAAPR